MGGTVPLGYDAMDRKLVVNKAEARTVVDIYGRYLRLKSVRSLREEIDAAGIRSKRRLRPDGTEYGNQRFSQGALYLLLQNRTYRGEATHKGNILESIRRSSTSRCGMPCRPSSPTTVLRALPASTPRSPVY